MLINDHRAAAKAVNDAMGDMNEQRTSPGIPREVQWRKHAHVFSHFDSRGGSCLMTGHKSTVEACSRYEKGFGVDPAWDMGFADLMAGSEGPVELIVCDNPLPPVGTDLLAEYGGIYTAAWLLKTFVYLDQYGQEHHWSAHRIALVLWDATLGQPFEGVIDRPISASGKDVYHLDTENCDLGEDACGLVLTYEFIAPDAEPPRV